MGILDVFFGKGGVFGRTTVSSESEDRIKKDWERIKSLIKIGGPSNLRQALISADRSLDTALRDIFAGESMGERLKEAKDKFDRPVYNAIWEAHKLRNSVVHEAGFEPPYYQVLQAIENLKKGLENYHCL
jgi:hypothetical protein